MVFFRGSGSKGLVLATPYRAVRRNIEHNHRNPDLPAEIYWNCESFGDPMRSSSTN